MRSHRHDNDRADLAGQPFPEPEERCRASDDNVVREPAGEAAINRGQITCLANELAATLGIRRRMMVESADGERGTPLLN
jgi:hypothetical protein